MIEKFKKWQDLINQNFIKKRLAYRKYGVMSEAQSEEMEKKASFAENLSSEKIMD